jgi:hypothetical protein
MSHHVPITIGDPPRAAATRGDGYKLHAQMSALRSRR